MSDFGSFTSGTLILTPRGDCLVQDLVAGDLVETLDGGAQPIRVTRKTSVVTDKDSCPVRFHAGVLNNEHDLVVHPDHRIRFSGWQSDLLFGEAEVLVPASAFVNGRTVLREDPMPVTYHQLWLDMPQIIFAERVATECGKSLDEVSDHAPRKAPASYHRLQAHEAEVLLAL
ncbi:Hint domain-containing protein [Litoreibacter sp.]|nr:Hint domain-containing protein [Litoreibacter sp.]